MKSLKINTSGAFAKGFERGFNAPWYFLAGDRQVNDYGRHSPEEEMVALKVRIISIPDDKKEATHRKK